MKGRLNRRADSAPPVLAIVALLLSLAVATTTSLALTSAKYVAQATVLAGARVARWEVKLESEDLPIEPKPIEADPLFSPNANAGADIPGKHPLLLFFKGLDEDGGNVEDVAASFEVDFANYSEVAANFTPWFTVTTPAATGPNDTTSDGAIALEALSDKIKFYTTWTGVAATSEEVPSTGLVLPPAAGGEPCKETLTVVIDDCTFTGLKIGAFCVQMD